MTTGTSSPLSKNLIILTIILLSSNLCYGSLYEWSLQLTDPEFELNHFKLPDDKEYKPFMAVTSWRCWFSETITKNDIQMKTMKCNYSSKKTGIITSYLSCSPQRPRNESRFDLVDEKKGLKFGLLFTCRKK